MTLMCAVGSNPFADSVAALFAHKVHYWPAARENDWVAWIGNKDKIVSIEAFLIHSPTHLHNQAMQRTRDAVCRYGKSAVAGR